MPSDRAAATPRQVERLLGLAVLGAMTSGIAALVLALVAAFSGRLEASSIALVAAALAFGLLANALLAR